MSVKADLERLVQLQAHQLELRRIAADLEEIERLRCQLEAEIEEARERIAGSEKEVEENRQQGRKLELDLKTAEDRVSKYKEQLLEVKTNKELWALQEEISRAEQDVGDIEEQMIRQLDRADELDDKIAARTRELEATTRKVEAGRAEARARADELLARRQRIDAAVQTVREQLPEELRDKFDQIEGLRAGVAVAEVRDETCTSCNVRLRPQLYVDLRNLSDILQCDNCKRIVYIRDTLDLPEALLPATSDDRPSATAASDDDRGEAGTAAQAPAAGSG